MSTFRLVTKVQPFHLISIIYRCRTQAASGRDGDWGMHPQSFKYQVLSLTNPILTIITNYTTQIPMFRVDRQHCSWPSLSIMLQGRHRSSHTTKRTAYVRTYRRKRGAYLAWVSQIRSPEAFKNTIRWGIKDARGEGNKNPLPVCDPRPPPRQTSSPLS